MHATGLAGILPVLTLLLLAVPAVQLLREGKWTFNTFLRNGLLEYLGEYKGRALLSACLP